MYDIITLLVNIILIIIKRVRDVTVCNDVCY